MPTEILSSAPSLGGDGVWRRGRMARDGDVMGREAISGRGIKEEMNRSQEMLPPLLILVIRCCDPA